MKEHCTFEGPDTPEGRELEKKLRKFTDEEIEAPSTNDREWFAAHPGVNYRIRFPMASELLGPNSDDPNRVIVVKQVCPGTRVRHAVTLIAMPDHFTEDMARSLWNSVTRDRFRPEELQALQEWEAKVRAIKSRRPPMPTKQSSVQAFAKIAENLGRIATALEWQNKYDPKFNGKMRDMEARLEARPNPEEKPMSPAEVFRQYKGISDKDLTDAVSKVNAVLKDPHKIKAVRAKYTTGAIATIPQDKRQAFINDVEALLPARR